MLLTGTFTRSIDEQQRITLPKELRAALVAAEGIFYVAPGTDGSLALYDERSFVRVAERLGDSPPTQRDVRAFGRLFYAQARRVEIDKQGRLRIPPELADWARLEKDAILLGVGDHMELWNAATWAGYMKEKKQNYDGLAEAAFSQPAEK